MCLQICLCVCVNVHVHECVYVLAPVYVHGCMHLCIYVYVRFWIAVCTSVCSHAFMESVMWMCMYLYTKTSLSIGHYCMFLISFKSNMQEYDERFPTAVCSLRSIP